MVKIELDKKKVKQLLEQKAELLKCISHPVRLCILTKLLLFGECNVSELQNCLDVPQSTVSQHLGKLRTSGILEKKRSGLEIYYSLVDEEIKAILEVILRDIKGDIE